VSKLESVAKNIESRRGKIDHFKKISRVYKERTFFHVHSIMYMEFISNEYNIEPRSIE